MTQLSFGGYVRHRDRMVQESILEDLQNTLIAYRWMTGTTSRLVIDPYNPGAGWVNVTTTSDQVLKIVGKREDGSVAQAQIIDYFPNTDQNDPEGGSPKTELNTLAVDAGVAQTPVLMELGSNLKEQQYAFTMALYASSDAVALAMMNDLRDRYEGRMISDDHLNLYNYNADDFDADTPAITRMEIDAFRYDQNADTVAPYEVHLYYAELLVTDYVDPGQAFVPVEEPLFRAIGFGEVATYDPGLDRSYTKLDLADVYYYNPAEGDPRFIVQVPDLTVGDSYDTSGGILKYAFRYNQVCADELEIPTLDGFYMYDVSDPVGGAVPEFVVGLNPTWDLEFVGFVMTAFSDETPSIDPA